MAIILDGSTGITSSGAITQGGSAVLTASSTVGKVLQVVNVLYSTQSSMTVGTTDTAVTGMNLNITPLGAGSKFRIDVRLFGEMAGGWDTMFNIHRGAARINTTSNLNYHGLSMMTQSYGGAANDATTPEILNLTTIDSTGSTVGTTLTYILVASTSVARTLWINRCFSAPAAAAETGVSEIIITEIGA
jgi:hypothetical protein